MFELIKRNPLAFIVSAAVHVLVVLFMIVGMNWQALPDNKKPPVQVVQARVVDESLLQSEIKKQQEKQAQKKKAEQQRVDELKRQQQAEEKRLAELEKQRKIQEQKARDAEKKRQLAEENRKKEAAIKKAEAEKQRKLAEEKRQKEEARKKAEAEKQRKLAEEKRQKAEAERLAREQEIAEQMAMEEAMRAQASAVAAIKGKIQQNWLQPVGFSKGLKCTVRVRLIPGGVIVPNSVSIVQSSGNGAFDRSVEQAIYKSEPLPVPQGAAFENFRSLTFIFDPSE